MNPATTPRLLSPGLPGHSELADSSLVSLDLQDRRSSSADHHPPASPNPVRQHHEDTRKEQAVDRGSSLRSSIKTEYKSNFTPFDQYVYNEVTDSFVKQSQVKSNLLLDSRSNQLGTSSSSQDLASSDFRGQSAVSPALEVGAFEPVNGPDANHQHNSTSEPWYMEVMKRNEKANEYRFKSELGHNSSILNDGSSSEQTRKSPLGNDPLVEAQIADKQHQLNSSNRFSSREYKRDHMISHMANNNNFKLPKEPGTNGVTGSSARRVVVGASASSSRTLSRTTAASRARSQSSKRTILSSKPEPTAKSNQTTPTKSVPSRVSSTRPRNVAASRPQTTSTPAGTTRPPLSAPRRPMTAATTSTKVSPPMATRSPATSSSRTPSSSRLLNQTPNAKAPLRSTAASASNSTSSAKPPLKRTANPTMSARPTTALSRTTRQSVKAVTTTGQSAKETTAIKSIKTKALADAVENSAIKPVEDVVVPADQAPDQNETNVTSTNIFNEEVGANLIPGIIDCYGSGQTESDLIFATSENGNMLADELAQAEKVANGDLLQERTACLEAASHPKIAESNLEQLDMSPATVDVMATNETEPLTRYPEDLVNGLTGGLVSTEDHYESSDLASLDAGAQKNSNSLEHRDQCSDHEPYSIMPTTYEDRKSDDHASFEVHQDSPRFEEERPNSTIDFESDSGNTPIPLPEKESPVTFTLQTHEVQSDDHTSSQTYYVTDNDEHRHKDITDEILSVDSSGHESNNVMHSDDESDEHPKTSFGMQQVYVGKGVEVFGDPSKDDPLKISTNDQSSNVDPLQHIPEDYKTNQDEAPSSTTDKSFNIESAPTDFEVVNEQDVDHTVGVDQLASEHFAIDPFKSEEAAHNSPLNQASEKSDEAQVADIANDDVTEIHDSKDEFAMDTTKDTQKIVENFISNESNVVSQLSNESCITEDQHLLGKISPDSDQAANANHSSKQKVHLSESESNVNDKNELLMNVAELETFELMKKEEMSRKAELARGQSNPSSTHLFGELLLSVDQLDEHLGMDSQAAADGISTSETKEQNKDNDLSSSAAKLEQHVDSALVELSRIPSSIDISDEKLETSSPEFKDTLKSADSSQENSTNDIANLESSIQTDKRASVLHPDETECRSEKLTGVEEVSEAKELVSEANQHPNSEDSKTRSFEKELSSEIDDHLIMDQHRREDNFESDSNQATKSNTSVMDDMDEEEQMKLSNHLTNSDDDVILEPRNKKDSLSEAFSPPRAKSPSRYNEGAGLGLMVQQDEVGIVELADGSSAEIAPTVAENRVEASLVPDISQTAAFAHHQNLIQEDDFDDNEDWILNPSADPIDVAAKMSPSSSVAEEMLRMTRQTSLSDAVAAMKLSDGLEAPAADDHAKLSKGNPENMPKDSSGHQSVRDESKDDASNLLKSNSSSASSVSSKQQQDITSSTQDLSENRRDLQESVESQLINNNDIDTFENRKQNIDINSDRNSSNVGQAEQVQAQTTPPTEPIDKAGRPTVGDDLTNSADATPTSN